MMETTNRYKRSTAEAFAEERFKTMTHFTDNKFLFKQPKDHSWIFGVMILGLIAAVVYSIVSQGIDVIETEMLIEEERAAVEAQQTRLAQQCKSWKFDEIDPGVYQCFDDTGRKTKIVRVK